ncbi:hypothetical protein PybrP1_004217 [[Pythium] brassicae (nom. inval.)]|nr:hypothetical protein PybrP1_004217 [[Pythium] brassicae (nom. inval.)]
MPRWCRQHTAAAVLLSFVLWTTAFCAVSAGNTGGAAAPTTQEAPELLLVVGSVSATRARVLFERPNGTAGTPFALRVRMFAAGSTVHHSQPAVLELQREWVVDAIEGGSPDVLRLDDLEPNRVYAVGLRVAATGDEEIIKFRTPLAPVSTKTETRAASDRVLVISCDRYVDDSDDTLWEQIVDDIERHPDSYFGMAHIGDQVYADAGAASIAIVPVPRALMTDQPELLRQRFDALVDQFRSVYRRTFGRPIVQRALRSGAHWMIPDDHEVVNNLNYERVQRVFGTAEAATPEHEQERLWGLALHYRAGLQVYYEYQYQLQADFPFAQVDFLLEPLDDVVARFPVHFAVEVSKLKMFFMDLRLDRGFFTKPDKQEVPSQLIGDAQMTHLEARLAHWSAEDQGNAVVVLSSVPLFFHSAVTGAITYLVEKERYPGMQAQLPGLQALFNLFARYRRSDDATHSALRLLVGGDVHTLAHSRVCERAAVPARCIDQLITSGATKGSTAITDLKLVPFYFLTARVVPFVSRLVTLLGLAGLAGLPPWDIEFDEVFLGRNFGVIELAPNGTFAWKASVVVPHEGDLQNGLQWIMDAPLVTLVVPVALVVSAHVAFFRR